MIMLSNIAGQVPGTKKDAGTTIWPSKLSPRGPRGFRKVLYYVRPLVAAWGKVGVSDFAYRVSHLL